MTTLSPTVQELFKRVREDKVGSRNLYRIERITSIARQLRASVDHRGLSVRKLAELMGTSASQAQRVLSVTNPSNVTIDTVLRAADAMGVEVDFHIRDPLRSTYYRQRSDFPVVREMTCFSRNTFENGEQARSEDRSSSPIRVPGERGGAYGKAV